MIATRALAQRLVPVLVVAGVLAVSFLARPVGSAVLVGCSYGYLGAPTITGIAPTSGSRLGGTVVTITGCGFTGATAVHFGATAAATFSVTNDSTVSATSPAHALGTVDIDVTTPAGTSLHTSADMFTFGNEVCTAVTAQANNSGPTTTAPSGFATLIQVLTVTGCTHPLFKYWVLNPGGSWTAISPYTSRTDWWWDNGGPEAPGSYTWSVWVQDATSAGTTCDSLGCKDAFKPGTAFTLTLQPCTVVNAVASPSSPQARGTTITIT